MKITPEMLQAKNYPKAGFYLTALGGILMFFEGLAAIFFRSLYYGINVDFWAGLSNVIIGIILIIIASIVSGAAVSLLVKPELRKTAGASIILFSLIGLLFGGGWVIGSVLGIIGGLLAIMWKPKA
jgi:hypothetical protein